MGQTYRLSVRWLVQLIKLYQYLLSPLLGSCRFHPSCSCYAVDAIVEHGFFRGVFFAFRRILRCQPWHPGGYDPIPKKR